jgi:1,4-alpha-glucan branching enzyme
MKKGYLAFIFHAHLPYIRHAESDSALEEDWLYEAIIETYIPIIRMLERLARDNISTKFSLSLTPPLLNMLSDKLLVERFKTRLDLSLEMAEREIKRTTASSEFNKTAKIYQNIFLDAKECLASYNDNLINAFKYFSSIGLIEILASAATHGYLPLMEVTPSCIKAQISLGIEEYKRFFDQSPKGFWLPECGFIPGIDLYLAKETIRYFITDVHGVLHASVRPRYANYAPIYTPNSVAAFARDLESSKQVWSATEGYPGDYDYRDFYRDIGFDLDYEYLKPFLEPIGIRKMTGFKYYRITGPTDHKEPYRHDVAVAKAKIHAANFVFNREAQIKHLNTIMDRPPILVAPYDAELFGHWWFEGPVFLEEVLRLISKNSVIETITPLEYLKRHPKNQVAVPSYSSWGYNGYNEVWLEGSNDWIYPHLHHAGWQLSELAKQENLNLTPLKKRLLNQAARELLLAQSSDWAFIMKTGTVAEYARKRTKEHLKNYLDLVSSIENPNVELLRRLEDLNPIFPKIDYRIFA